MIYLRKHNLKIGETVSFNELNKDVITIHNLYVNFDHRCRKAFISTSYIFRTDTFGGINPFNKLLSSGHTREKPFLSLEEINKASWEMKITDDRFSGTSDFLSVQNVKYYFGSVGEFNKHQKDKKIQYCSGKLKTPSVEVFQYHPNNGYTPDESDYYLITEKATCKDRVMAGIIHFDRGAHLAQMLEREEYVLLKDSMHGHDEWDKIRPHYIVGPRVVIHKSDVSPEEWMMHVKKAEKDKDIIRYIKAFR